MGHGGHHAGMSMDDMVRDMRNRFLVAALLSIPTLLWSPIGRQVIGFSVPAPFGLRDDVFSVILSLPMIFYSAWIFFDGAWRALRARTLDMVVLVAVAIGARSSAAGGTSRAKPLPRCRSRPSRPREPRSRRSTTPRTRPTPEPLRRRSPPGSASSGPRPPRRSPTTSTCCSLLRLPSRALDPPADHEPDRVDLRHGPAQNQGHEGSRLPRRRRGHGVQADRGSPDPVADGQRTPPGRTRPRRSPLRQRQTRRVTQRPRSTRRSSSGVRHANPQVLTIAQRRAKAGSVGDSRRSPREAKFS
jgi:hypothetical protein